jgi:HAD superfamily hydrolase (TIGR01549 family)
MKAVVFDLDGVLVDSAALFANVVKEALTGYGYPVSIGEVTRAQIANVETWVSRLVSPEAAARDELVRKISARVRAEVAAQTAALSLAPEAPEVLSAIAASYHLLLLTNSSSSYAHAILSRHAIEELFKQVITSDDPFNSKEEAIASIAESYALDLHDVIYVGDTVRDVRCATAAGCRALIVYTPWSWDWRRLDAIETAGPDAVVKSLGAIMDVLGKW